MALIARREIVSRLQQRGFRIGFLVTLLLVVLGCTVPALFRDSGHAKHYRIGIANGPQRLGDALVAVGATQHVQVIVVRGAAAEQAQQVRHGRLDAAIVPGHLVVRHAGDVVAGLAQTGYRLATSVDRLRAAGLSARQAAGVLDTRPLAVTTTTSQQSGQRQSIAFLAIIVLFGQLVTFCTWVAMGVVEEKSSRVIELVLSSVRPLQLLTGKLLGIGALAAAQVLTLGVVALIAAAAASTLTVPASAVGVLFVAFGGFVLGFAFFAALAAALASTVSRQEEVSGVLAPVTVTLTVSYLVSFAAASSPDGVLARIISIVPPFSAIAMPARFAGGAVSPVNLVFAAVLLVAATAGIVAVAARVYRASVLHSGTRVPLRRAWRGDVVA